MRWAIIAIASLLMVPVPSAADDSGCEKFAWSLGHDRARFVSPEKPTIVVGSQLTSIPATAFVLRLHPASEASFEAPPERVPKSGAWFGGSISPRR